MEAWSSDPQATVREARRRGARGCEVLLTESRGRSLRIPPRGASQSEEIGQSHLKVTVWLEGGRQGVAQGVPGDATVLDLAFALAASADQDPFGGPVPQEEHAPRGLGIDDPRHDQITDEDRLELAMSNLRAAARPSGVTVKPLVYRELRERRRFANSLGVVLEAPTTTYEAICRVVSESGLVLQEAHASRAFASVACVSLGPNLARRVRDLQQPAVALTGPVRLLLPPRASAALIDTLADVLLRESLRPGSTFFRRRDDGQHVHRRLHLVDDGAMPGGLRTRAFDDRGVRASPITVLREGVMCESWLDAESARRLQARVTGHAFGAGLRPSNLILNSGPRSIAALLGESDAPVLEVDHLELGGAFDVETGAFTLRIHGVVWDRHSLRGAVRGAILRGTLPELLNQVVAVTSDTDRVGHVDAPGLLLDGARVEAD